MNTIIIWLVGKGLSSTWAKRLAWSGAALIMLAVLGISIAVYLNVRDNRVRTEAIKTEQVEDAEARGKSAEDRAWDSIINSKASEQRTEAIATAEAKEQAKPPAERATLSPQEMALACARLRQRYTKAELAEMAAYKEKCQ